jgi:peptidase M48-like protein
MKRRDDEPGTRLDLARHPKLGTLLGEVAAAVGTGSVDVVYLTPGTDIAVMERGGMLRQLTRRSARCLILGVGVLDGMRVGPFKAILAHEFGHLSNQDTAGGGFALAVRRSLITMAHHLAASGAAAWYNPAWLFLNGFYRLFLRISQGASRLQEVLADRWAGSIYGAEAFEQGLRHVIERSVRFDAYLGATLKEVVETKAALANLYQHRPATPPAVADIDAAVEVALNRPPSPYDSHPSPVARFRWVRALPSQGARSSPGDDAEVWSLFDDRTATEVAMTEVVRKNVNARYGVDIPAAERAAPSRV